MSLPSDSDIPEPDSRPPCGMCSRRVDLPVSIDMIENGQPLFLERICSLCACRLLGVWESHREDN